MTRKVEVAIVGAGTAGLAALAQVKKKTDSYVLINGGELGTTCARVGCMPSKVAIQVADDFQRRTIFEREAIEGGESLSVDIPEAFEHVRDIRDILVDRVLSHTTDDMGEELIDGYAHFIAPGVLQVDDQTIEAENIILAVGTSPVIPEAWRQYGEQILTTDSLFELEQWPSSMAIIGLGVIGLEMGQVLQRLGIQVNAFDMQDNIAGIADPAVLSTAVTIIGKELPLHLGKQVTLEQQGDLLSVSNGEVSVAVEKVLLATGRRSNLYNMQLENSGIPLRDDGLPKYNPNTTRVVDSRVFVAGDADVFRPILHEASAEGKIAGYNAVRSDTTAFIRNTSLQITFSDPNICQIGEPFDTLHLDEIVIGEQVFGPLGRALIMGKNKGLLRIYVRKADGILLGAAMVATKGENLAHLIAWSIEQHMTVQQVLGMPYYHPTIEEALQAAARNAISKLPHLVEDQDYPADLKPLSSLL